MMRLFMLITALGTLLAGCTPVTLDNEPAIDFERYRSVYVEPLQGEGSTDDRRFLAARLAEDSGFSLVTTDPNVDVDTVLFVRVDLVDVDTDQDGDLTYDVNAIFRLEDAYNRSVIDRGEVRDDASYEDEAFREALDDVVLHYLRAYRI